LLDCLPISDRPRLLGVELAFSIRADAFLVRVTLIPA
jgi:hypothetical protein